MDLVSKMVVSIRQAVGLPADRGAPPDLMRLGLYRATVVTATADGKFADVQPEDSRIAPEQNVPIRVGIPGTVAAVAPGAIVLLGWEKGDPSRPYCAPHWESGATVLTLNLNAQSIVLNNGAQGVARVNDPISPTTAGPYPVSGQTILSGSTTVKAG